MTTLTPTTEWRTMAKNKSPSFYESLEGCIAVILAPITVLVLYGYGCIDNKKPTEPSVNLAKPDPPTQPRTQIRTEVPPQQEPASSQLDPNEERKVQQRIGEDGPLVKWNGNLDYKEQKDIIANPKKWRWSILYLNRKDGLYENRNRGWMHEEVNKFTEKFVIYHLPYREGSAVGEWYKVRPTTYETVDDLLNDDWVIVGSRPSPQAPPRRIQDELRQAERKRRQNEKEILQKPERWKFRPWIVLFRKDGDTDHRNRGVMNEESNRKSGKFVIWHVHSITPANWLSIQPSIYDTIDQLQNDGWLIPKDNWK